MKTMILALFLVAPVACVSGTVTEPVTLSVKLGTLPPAPVAGVLLPAQSFTTGLDVSQAVSKVTSVADNVEADVSSLVLHSASDISWLRQATVSLQLASGGASQQLAHFDPAAGTANNTATFVIDMQPDALLGFLRAPAKLTFTVSGVTTTSPVTIDDTLTIVITGHASKSI